MRDSISSNEANSAKLFNQYETAWRRFSLAVNHYQWLEANAETSEASLSEARATVKAAEDEYREARNAFADDLREQSSRNKLLLTCEC